MPQPDDDVVTRLVDSQVRRAISRYRGNLSGVLRGTEMGWIPEGDEPDIPAHLEALRAHLAATGVAEDDSFLLRYALRYAITVPWTQRAIVSPMMVLEPNRNGFSERRKREAAGQVTRLREALDLGRAFLPGLSQDTTLALAELEAIAAGRPDPGSPSTLEQFRRLSADQAREVASIALRSIEGPAAPVRELATELLQNLACFRFDPLGPETCRRLRDVGIIWPACLYRDAGDAVAEEFLALIDRADDSLSLPPLVLCLAWTRSRVAEANFRVWSENPPRWATSLRVPLGEYLPDAGWCLNAGGERLELISQRCHRLRPADAGSPGAIACLAPIQQLCPCCQSPLAALFDFSSIEADLPRNAPRKVICCLYCSMFAQTVVAYHDDGSWEWIAPATSSPPTFEAPETRYLAREVTECPPFAAANIFEMDDATTIGGVPMWIQVADYPRCPSCNERMRFLAQHDNSAIREDGIYYAHYCPGCHVAAVNYQQT